MPRVIGRPPRGLSRPKRRVDGLTGFTGDGCQNANEADPKARLVRNDLLSGWNYQLVPEGQLEPDIVRVTAPPPVGRVMMKLQPDLDLAVIT